MPPVANSEATGGGILPDAEHRPGPQVVGLAQGGVTAEDNLPASEQHREAVPKRLQMQNDMGRVDLKGGRPKNTCPSLLVAREQVSKPSIARALGLPPRFTLPHWYWPVETAPFFTGSERRGRKGLRNFRRGPSLGVFTPACSRARVVGTTRGRY